MNETYHSVHGAVQESKYVFIEKGLRHWRASHANGTPSILEVGFGTGLNAFLTAIVAIEERTKIAYTSLEAYPLSKELWSQLNYSSILGHHGIFEWLHNAPWSEPETLADIFVLHKKHERLEEVHLPESSFDLIYFDAFAPSKQPEMWTLDLLVKVSRSLKPEGVFVTYCAKGQLKRDLKATGLIVETLPGPPGKKEMVRALKP